MNEIVSIVIPTYGRPKYLERALNSVLNQSYEFIEVIVVDDNNPGTPERIATEKLMKGFIEKKDIKYIQHEKNINGSAARNTGLKASSGEYITFLDDDDEFLKEKIEKQVLAIKQFPEYDAIYCMCEYYFKNKKVSDSIYAKDGNCAFDVLRLKADIPTPSMFLKRSKVESINGFDESFKRHQEYEFMTRFFETSSMYCVKEVLLRINIDSTLNRPNIDKLLEAKEHFFKKLKPYIVKYTKEEQSEIYKAHNLQLFRVALKSYDLRSIKYFFKAKPNYQDIKFFIFPYIKKYIRLFGIKIIGKS